MRINLIFASVSEGCPEELAIDVPPSTRISTLKLIICDATDIAPQEQRILGGFTDLPDAISLAELQVPEAAILVVVKVGAGSPLRTSTSRPASTPGAQKEEGASSPKSPSLTLRGGSSLVGSAKQLQTKSQSQPGDGKQSAVAPGSALPSSPSAYPLACGHPAGQGSSSGSRPTKEQKEGQSQQAAPVAGSRASLDLVDFTGLDGEGASSTADTEAVAAAAGAPTDPSLPPARQAVASHAGLPLPYAYVPGMSLPSFSRELLTKERAANVKMGMRKMVAATQAAADAGVADWERMIPEMNPVAAALARAAAVLSQATAVRSAGPAGSLYSRHSSFRRGRSFTLNNGSGSGGAAPAAGAGAAGAVAVGGGAGAEGMGSPRGGAEKGSISRLGSFSSRPSAAGPADRRSSQLQGPLSPLQQQQGTAEQGEGDLAASSSPQHGTASAGTSSGRGITAFPPAVQHQTTAFPPSNRSSVALSSAPSFSSTGSASLASLLLAQASASRSAAPSVNLSQGGRSPAAAHSAGSTQSQGGGRPAGTVGIATLNNSDDSESEEGLQGQEEEEEEEEDDYDGDAESVQALDTDALAAELSKILLGHGLGHRSSVRSTSSSTSNGVRRSMGHSERRGSAVQRSSLPPSSFHAAAAAAADGGVIAAGMGADGEEGAAEADGMVARALIKSLQQALMQQGVDSGSQASVAVPPALAASPAGSPQAQRRASIASASGGSSAPAPFSSSSFSSSSPSHASPSTAGTSTSTNTSSTGPGSSSSSSSSSSGLMGHSLTAPRQGVSSLSLRRTVLELPPLQEVEKEVDDESRAASRRHSQSLLFKASASNSNSRAASRRQSLAQGAVAQLLSAAAQAASMAGLAEDDDSDSGEEEGRTVPAYAALPPALPLPAPSLLQLWLVLHSGRRLGVEVEPSHPVAVLKQAVAQQLLATRDSSSPDIDEDGAFPGLTAANVQLVSLSSGQLLPHAALLDACGLSNGDALLVQIVY